MSKSGLRHTGFFLRGGGGAFFLLFWAIVVIPTRGWVRSVGIPVAVRINCGCVRQGARRCSYRRLRTYITGGQRGNSRVFLCGFTWVILGFSRVKLRS